MCKRSVIALALLLAVAAWSASALAQTPPPTVVIVVRHAEKAAVEGPDPPLSEAGAARAQRLKEMTSAAEVVAAYTTQFKRTRDTAAALGVPVVPFEINGGNMANYPAMLAKEILSKHKGKTVLVVGHSNTTPQIVEALSGRRVPPLDDAKDFDALYVVVIPDAGAPRLVRGKY